MNQNPTPGFVPADEGERLQKVLARAGFGSRRVCEDIIDAGRVTVDGRIAVLGARVRVEDQEVAVDGTPIGIAPDLVHYLLNKYGIITLITARYIAFVRTAYPYIVGANEIPQGRFLVVNLISSIMWICPLVGLGYYLSHTKLAAQYESQFLSVILYLPVVLLVGGLIALVWRWWSRRKPGVSRE